MTMERIPTGVAPFDAATEGGLIPGKIFQAFGEPGSGLSLLVLQAAEAFLRRGAAARIISCKELGTPLDLRHPDLRACCTPRRVPTFQVLDRIVADLDLPRGSFLGVYAIDLPKSDSGDVSPVGCESKLCDKVEKAFIQRLGKTMEALGKLTQERGLATLVTNYRWPFFMKSQYPLGLSPDMLPVVSRACDEHVELKITSHPEAAVKTGLFRAFGRYGDIKKEIGYRIWNNTLFG